jgi:S1-C subfamily serine protease
MFPRNWLAGIEGWGQDPDAAMAQAAREKKDLLLVFYGSDWCPWSMKLGAEILSTPDFRRDAEARFVPVLVDFPQLKPGQDKLQDRLRNRRLARAYRVTGFPTLVLADARGRPYAYEGYVPSPPEQYAWRLEGRQTDRQERDRLLDDAGDADTPTRLEAAREALAFLRSRRLLASYVRQLQVWEGQARRLDPGNARGQAEVFFEALWREQAAALDPAAPGATEEVRKAVDHLEAWERGGPFRDADRAAALHLDAALLWGGVRDYTAALGEVRRARGYKAGPRMQGPLAAAGSDLGLFGGSGCAVSADGLVLTSDQFLFDQEPVFVRWPGSAELVKATVQALDRPLGLALLRAEPPAGVQVKPLPWAKQRVPRQGEMVAAAGYPAGEIIDPSVKLTRGVVFPPAGTWGRTGLDVQINPGNTGGPLLDHAGNALGLVLAWPPANDPAASGQAVIVPGGDVAAFLQAQRVELPPAAADGAKDGWKAVGSRAAASVVWVVKTFPPHPLGSAPPGSGAGTASPAAASPAGRH